MRKQKIESYISISTFELDARAVRKEGWLVYQMAVTPGGTVIVVYEKEEKDEPAKD